MCDPILLEKALEVMPFLYLAIAKVIIGIREVGCAGCVGGEVEGVGVVGYRETYKLGD